jgi:hypothetical protein
MSLLKFRPMRRDVSVRENGIWERVTRRSKIVCCDCGLVHRVVFRVRNGYLENFVARDEKATAQARSGKKISKKVT